MNKFLVFLFVLIQFSDVFGQNENQYFEVRKDDKWGLINQTGEIIIPAVYDKISSFDSSFIIIQRNGLYGIIDFNNEIIIEPKYKDIKSVNAALYIFFDGTHWSIINLKTKNHYPIKEKYDYISCENNFIIGTRNKKRGVINYNGELLLESEFDEIFIKYNCIIGLKKRTLMLHNSKGKFLTKIDSLETIVHIERGFCFFKNERKWGVIQNSGTVVQPNEWDGYELLLPNYVTLSNNGWKVLHTSNFEEISDLKFEDVKLIGNFLVGKGTELTVVFDENGNKLFDTQFSIDVGYENFDFFGIKTNHGKLLLNRKGEQIFPTAYHDFDILGENLIVTFDMDRIGFADKNGQFHIKPFVYVDYGISGSMAYVLKSNGVKVVFLDEDNNFVDAQDFKDLSMISLIANDAQNNLWSWRNNNSQRNVLDINPRKVGWFKRGKFWGLNDSTNKQRIPPVFMDVKSLKNGISRIRKEQRNSTTYGLVNHNEYKIITQPAYRSIEINDFSNSKSVARANNFDHSITLLDTNGQKKIDRIKYIGNFNTPTSRVCLSGRRKLCKKTDPFNIDDWHPFKYSEARWVLINNDGDIVSPREYDFIAPFFDSTAVVYKDDKVGLINRFGEEFIPPKYDSISRFNFVDSIYKVHIKVNTKGLIDDKGKELTDCIYDEIYPYVNGLAKVKRNELYGYIDRDGKEVIPCEYAALKAPSENRIAFQSNWRWGYLNFAGDTVIEAKFNSAGKFSENRANVKMSYRRTVIDSTGKPIFKHSLYHFAEFESGLSFGTRRKKIYILDSLGKEIVSKRGFKPKRLSAYCFSYNNNRRKTKIINLKVDDNDKLEFDLIYPFHNGYAPFKNKGKYGLVDENFTEVVSAVYDNISFVEKKYYAAEKKKRWHVFNFNGDTISHRGYYGLQSVNDDIRKTADGYVNVLQHIQFRGLSDALTLHNSFFTKRWAKDYYNKFNEFKNQTYIQSEYNTSLYSLTSKDNYKITDKIYADLSYIATDRWSFKLHTYCGLVNKEGDVLLKPQYKLIKYEGNGIVQLKNSQKIGYYDVINKKWIWPMTE